MSDRDRLDELRQRYLALAHAMQSGVAMEMQIDGRTSATEAKHLRVGINCAMSDQGGLVQLLIAKGVFTELEYYTAMVEAMAREKAKYEASLTAHYGRPVTLA